MKVIPVVPPAARRVLNVGLRGNDVMAAGRLVARSLTHKGLPTINAQNGVYGDGLLNDILRFQKASGLKPDGEVGVKTWVALDPQMHDYERLLLHLPTPPPASLGQKLAHQFEVAYALGLDYYSQMRPGPRGFVYPWKKKADCSDSYLLFRALVLGQPYDGYGNTGTIWSTYTPIHTPEVGVAALYGPGWKTTHVQCVTDISDLANPQSIGFGSAPGNKYPVHTRGDFMGYRRTV